MKKIKRFRKKQKIQEAQWRYLENGNRKKATALEFKAWRHYLAGSKQVSRYNRRQVR